jgi:hypothetical protein
LCVSTAEFYPPELQDQTVAPLAAVVQATGRLPGTFYGATQNHSSMISNAGTENSTIGDGIVEFMRSATRFHAHPPAAQFLDRTLALTGTNRQ